MLKYGNSMRGPLRLQQRLTALNYAVISDGRHLQTMLADTLRNFGIRRIHIRSHPSGMDPMLDGRPDVILWDWGRPDWDSLKELTRVQAGWRPALIILDVATSPERVAMAVTGGAPPA